MNDRMTVRQILVVSDFINVVVYSSLFDKGFDFTDDVEMVGYAEYPQCGFGPVTAENVNVLQSNHLLDEGLFFGIIDDTVQFDVVGGTTEHSVGYLNLCAGYFPADGPVEPESAEQIEEKKPAQGQAAELDDMVIVSGEQEQSAHHQDNDGFIGQKLLHGGGEFECFDVVHNLFFILKGKERVPLFLAK